MDRYFPDVDEYGHRKGVCRRCHVVMFDVEPESSYGQFYHPRLDKKGKPHWCPNAGKCLNTQDKELEPFLRKAERRRNKRIRRWIRR